jgi:hypothetical protein
MESEALMDIWFLPWIVGLGGGVILIMLIILHLIEEYRNDKL